MKVSEKHLRWIFLILIVISFAVNYAGHFDRKLDPNGDNYHYFLLGHNLATGHGYVSNIGRTPVPYTHFPPGYPLFLSVFLHVFPDNVVAMKVLNGLLLLVSLLLLFRIVRKTTGRYGIWYAFAACLLCTFHTILLRWSTILMSEMLYTAISLGIIAICLELDLDKLRNKDRIQILLLVGLCLLVASAFLVRTMGLSVVLAAGLAFLVLLIKGLINRKKEPRGWLMPLVVWVAITASILITMTAWNHRNQRVQPGWQSDYWTSFKLPTSTEKSIGFEKFWLSRIEMNLRAFVPYYIPYTVFNPDKARLNNMAVEKRDMIWMGGVLTIGVILVGLLAMKGLQWLLILYVLITFGVLVIYPPQFADTRYFVPLIPLLLAGFVVGVGTIVAWIVKRWKQQERTWPAIVAVAVTLAVLLPVYYTSQYVYRTIGKSSSYGELPGMGPYQEYIDACIACREFPPNRLTAAVKPEIFHVYSKYHHAVSIPRSGTPEEVIQYLEDNLVDVIIIDSWYPAAYRVLLPTAEMYPERFTVLGTFGNPDEPTWVVGFLPLRGWVRPPKPDAEEAEE